MPPTLPLSLFLSVFLFAQAQQSPTDTGRSCAPGTFNDGNACVECPINTISTRRNQFSCTPCPPTLSAYSGSTSCEPCSAGSIPDRTGKETCIKCPPGTYNDKVGASECKKCPKGTPGFYEESSSVKDCAKDFKCDPGMIISQSYDCEMCPTKSINNKVNSITCTKCPLGTHTTDYGRTRCHKCPSGYFGVNNPVGCRPCPQGTYSNRLAALECRPCPKGSTSKSAANSCRPACEGGTKRCAACPPGMQLSKKGKCQRCPKGKVSDRYSTTPCFECDEDLQPNADHTKCVCGRNEFPYREDPFVIIQNCARCARGATSDGETCRCNGGKIYYGGCICPPGQKEEGNKCVACAKKEIVNSFPRVCGKCGFGQFLNVTANGGLGACDPCPGGTINPKGGLNTSCKKCEKVARFQGMKYCGCEPGKEMRKGKCVPCEPGSYSIFSNRCARCPPGTFAADKGTPRCRKCPKGQRPKKYGATECLPPCPANAERPYESLQCQCMKSFFSAKKEVSASGEDLVCKPCSGLKVRNPRDVTKCVCPPGTYVNGRGCTECSPGSFSSGFDSRKCALCPINQAQRATGRAFCPSCDPGKIAPFKGSTRCRKKCPDGQFVGKGGNCTSCKPGRRVRNRECVKCEEGISSGGDMGYCRDCPKNSAPNKDKTACVRK